MTRYRTTKTGGKHGGTGVSSEWTGAVSEEISMDFSADELSEFLEADLLGVEADPQFKEELREKLWTLVNVRLGGSRRRGK